MTRKTGYKILDRSKSAGLSVEQPLQVAGPLCSQLPQVEILIGRLKSEKPHWDVRKIRELLVCRLDGPGKSPACWFVDPDEAKLILTGALATPSHLISVHLRRDESREALVALTLRLQRRPRLPLAFGSCQGTPWSVITQ